jgi:hypothetical protein
VNEMGNPGATLLMSLMAVWFLVFAVTLTRKW